jgi:hypothetical protein
MADPIVSASLDKPTYKLGEPMTLTVTYSDPDHDVAEQTITVEDSAGTKTVVTTTAIVDPLTVTVSDPDRTWSKVSDNGQVAVFAAAA